MKCICYSLVLQGQLLASAGAAKDNHAGKPSDLVHYFTTTNQSQFSTTWSALEAAHLDGPSPSSLPLWLRCLTIRELQAQDISPWTSSGNVLSGENLLVRV